jgi:hypothetical protein
MGDPSPAVGVFCQILRRMAGFPVSPFPSIVSSIEIQ